LGKIDLFPPVRISSPSKKIKNIVKNRIFCSSSSKENAARKSDSLVHGFRFLGLWTFSLLASRARRGFGSPPDSQCYFVALQPHRAREARTVPLKSVKSPYKRHKVQSPSEGGHGTQPIANHSPRRGQREGRRGGGRTADLVLGLALCVRALHQHRGLGGTPLLPPSLPPPPPPGGRRPWVGSATSTISIGLVARLGNSRIRQT